MNMWVRYIYRAHLPHWTFSPTCDTAYCNTPNNHLQQKYCTPFYFWCICDLNFNTWEAWQKESCSCLHKGFSNLRKDIWLLQTTGIHFKWIFFKVWYKAHLIICFCLRGEINAPKYRKQIQRNEQIQKQRNSLFRMWRICWDKIMRIQPALVVADESRESCQKRRICVSTYSPLKNIHLWDKIMRIQPCGGGGWE